MKPMKNPVFIGLLLILFFSASMLTGTQFKNYDDLKFQQLNRVAVTRGYVYVVVKLEVPGIEELTEKSRRFRTGLTDKSLIQSAADADLELETAISDVTNSLLHRLNGKQYRLNHHYSTIPYAALSVSSEALSQLKKSPEILEILEDTPLRIPGSELPEPRIGTPDRPLLNTSIGLVGADKAWSYGVTGKGWYVAVIDTGLRTSHEMFQGKQIVEGCFSTGSYLEESGGCPNGETEMTGPGSAVHDPDYNHLYSYDHGTHVMGIAAGNNGVDHFGVAKDADIMPINVFSYYPAYDELVSYSSDATKGLEYIYSLRNTYNIAAVNISLGGGYYYDYCNADMRAAAIINLEAAGIATAISSGNDGGCSYVSAPACVEKAVTVNGTDDFDFQYYSGNWHDDMVDLMAPGVQILSSLGGSDTSYGNASGTSMASPHVAGAFALLKSLNGNLSVDDSLTALKDTGQMIISQCSNAAVQKPRIDVGEAISSLLSLYPPINLAGTQHANQALLQTEYINAISWASNPLNDGISISYYKIYEVQGTQFTLISQVDGSTFSYLHRAVSFQQGITYVVTSVDENGNESVPGFFTMEY
ncbi:MAG: S8 family serine peptidase [bacterium]|nr:S8 family serine peptidase [bacterium]